MKLKFTWAEGSTEAQATCTAEDSEADSVSPLACLLMDDGGLDTRTSLAWLREGSARANAVLAGVVKGTLAWDREAWGTVIGERETTVYSLHDEQCAEVIATPSFLRVLVEWLNFVGAEAGSKDVVVVI